MRTTLTIDDQIAKTLKALDFKRFAGVNHVNPFVTG
jgi:hypothetical protein